jgi:tetratricopeptide (TPR) repeat protein
VLPTQLRVGSNAPIRPGAAPPPDATSLAEDAAAPPLTLDQQPGPESGPGALPLAVAGDSQPASAQMRPWSHLSSFEKMGRAMHILTTKFERPVEVARTANASKILSKDLQPEVLQRRCEDIVAAAMAAERKNLARYKVDLRAQPALSMGLSDKLKVTGRYAELEPLLRKILSGEGRDFPAYSYLVQILLQGGPERAQDVIDAANAALQMYPHEGEFHAAIARAHLMAGDKESARQKLGAMLRSKDDELLIQRRDAALLHAEIEGTRQAIDQALLQFPTAFLRRDEAYALARFFASRGDADAFLHWMERARETIYSWSDLISFMDVALSHDVAKHGDQTPWGPVRQAALLIAQEARDQAPM